MFQAYSVGATLKLTDLVTPQLLKLSREFAKLDNTIARTNAKLKQLGSQAQGVRVLANAMKSVSDHAGMGAKQTNLLEKALGRVTGQAAGMQATAAATQQIGFAAQRASAHTATLHRQLIAAQAAGRQVAIAPVMQAPGYVRHGRNGGLHGGGVSMSRAGIGVGAVGIGSGTAGGMMGAGMAITGAAGLMGANAALGASKSYEQAFGRFKTMNLGDKVNREADKFARGANIFGVSSTEMMDTFREMYGFIGDMDMAKRLAPQIAALNQANAQLFGEGKVEPGMARSLLRFIDMRGATNSVDAAEREIDVAQRIVTGSSGAIGFGDLERMGKTGGVAFKALSHQGLFNLASVAQEIGGDRLGTALMSMYQNMQAGRITKQAMASAKALGLGDIVQEKIGTVGGKTQTRNRWKINEEFGSLLASDPLAAVQKFVIPAIDRIYGNGGKASDEVTLREVNNFLSNRTGANLIGTLATQDMQVARDAKLAREAHGAQGTIAIAQSGGTGADAQLRARWQSALSELGSSILPVATDAVKALASALQGFGTWAKDNEGKAKALTYAFIGLSGAMLLGGSLKLMTAAFGGLGLVLGPAVAAIGGAAGRVGLVAAIGALASPAGIAAAALGTLAAAAYAFRGMKQGEVDASRMAASVPAQLTGDAAARVPGALGGVANPKPLPKPKYEFWHKDSLFGKMFGSTPTDRSTEGLRPLSPTIMPREGSPFVPSGRSTVVESHVQVNVDGRKMAEAVSREQSREQSRPWPGQQRFDSSRSLLPPGAVLNGGR